MRHPAGGGRLTGGLPVSYTEETRDVNSVDDYPCNSVYLPDHCGAAAKREGRRPGGSVRRHGLADCVRPPRFRNAALEGHHAIGDPLHDHVVLAFDSCDAYG